MKKPEMTPERADYNARCYVNGMRMHGRSHKMEPASGEFSTRFASHPWCREAVIEGWGKELRSHLIMTVKRRIMAGVPYDVIEDLMPPREWIDVAKRDAARYRSAFDWQKQHRPHPVALAALLSKIAKQSGIKYDPETGEIG